MGTQPSTSASNSCFRKLTSVFLISSSVFAKAAPAQQTEVLSQSNGLPVVFVPSFYELQNPSSIRSKLLKGEDVSLEFEFNNITLSDEDQRGLKLIQPLLEKIASIGPDYPWLAPVDHKNITFTDETIVRNGYSITKEAAERVWKKASKVWATGKGVSDSVQINTGGQFGSRWVSVTKAQCTIGCQTLKRSEIEFVARQLGWAPVTA
jgi:hypothetical protein